MSYQEFIYMYVIGGLGYIVFVAMTLDKKEIERINNIPNVDLLPDRFVPVVLTLVVSFASAIWPISLLVEIYERSRPKRK